jgi:hypothetical protein
VSFVLTQRSQRTEIAHRLTQHEIDTIAAWVDGGAPQGNAADLPKAPEFAEGWSIGKPDLVFKMH